MEEMKSDRGSCGKSGCIRRWGQDKNKIAWGLREGPEKVAIGLDWKNDLDGPRSFQGIHK